MKRAMARDFSWDRSAGEYVELYRRALDKGRQRQPAANEGGFTLPE
jgi:glycogen synthase